mgnify:CR=1 FL=1
MDTIEELNDGGLIAYEALIVDTYGPRIYQASITPKGRAFLHKGPSSSSATK